VPTLTIGILFQLFTNILFLIKNQMKNGRHKVCFPSIKIKNKRKEKKRKSRHKDYIRLLYAPSVVYQNIQE
jgi:hypothetical protein